MVVQACTCRCLLADAATTKDDEEEDCGHFDDHQYPFSMSLKGVI